MNQRPAPPGERLDETVERRRKRRARWEREGERSLAQNLAMIGSLGWLIVLPTLAGIVLGRWIDHRAGTRLAFTGALLLVGLVAGCMLAWQRMHAS